MRTSDRSEYKMAILFVLLATVGIFLLVFLSGCGESHVSQMGVDDENPFDRCSQIECKDACLFVGYEGGSCVSDRCQCNLGEDGTGTDLDGDSSGDHLSDSDDDITTDIEEQEKGNVIAFETNRDGNWEIYLANGDGSYVTRVTTEPGHDLHPCLSPDGEHIVFDSTRDGNQEIYLMRRNGTEVTRLTNNHFVDEQPVFSPDGTEIAFVSNRDGSKDIYTMNLKGTGLTRLTKEYSHDENPLYSPDGSKLFFISNRNHGAGEIYSIDSHNGTRLTRLTNNNASERSLSVSPDGTTIVFSSNMDGNFELYTINSSDGGSQSRLTNTNALWENWPTWSKDGQQIYYSACHWFDCNVYVVGSDGFGVSQLTHETRSEHPSTAYGRPVNVL